VSPALLDRYISAARKISRLAVGDASAPSTVETYKVSRFFVQDDRMNDDLPFGSRGGATIVHTFPADGEYELSIRLGMRFDNDAIQGLDAREELDFRLDGVRVKLFAVGGECIGSKEPRCVKSPGLAQASEYERTADDHLHVRFTATSGPHMIGVTFLKKNVAEA